MSQIEEILKNNNHHAYLLVGQPAGILSALEGLIKNKLKSDDLSSNPDYWQERFPTFGIKESLDLRGRQTKRAFGEAGRYFVLTIDSITIEAQNALLKTFEEPASDVHFFIIVRSEDIFLPTLKSRFEIINVSHNVSHRVANIETFPAGSLPKGSPRSLDRGLPLGKRADEIAQVEKFLKLEPQERLDFVQKEFIKNKETSKGEILDFLGELETALRGKVRKMSEADKELIFALEEIAKARGYLMNPRSSARLILEHIAMII